MAEKTTFIKLDRNILNWGWFRSTKILHVFIWLMLKANIKEGHFENDTVKRGSLVTSNARIAEECGLTIDNVRTALANLESTGEITRIIRNRYQLITVVNYDAYQSDVTKNRWQIPTDPEVKSQPTAMSNPNNQRKKEEKKERRKEDPPTPQGGTSPSGVIPEMYRDMNFKSYDEYKRWRNQ